MKTTLILLVLLLVLMPRSFAVDPPGVLNHQGRIVVNNVNHDGDGYFKFALVNGAGTASYWSNDGTSVAGGEPAAAVEVPVVAGHYAVLLGDAAVPNMSTAVPAAVFADHDEVALRMWFSTAAGGPFELLVPDRRIAATGYALSAKQAQGVAAGAVTSTMLADAAVTGGKIARGAVTGVSIADGAVGAADLALGATGMVRKPVLLSELGVGETGSLMFNPMSLQFDPAGGLDPSFGADGKVVVHVDADDTAFAVAIQDDGKIVIAGHTSAGDDGFVVGRLLENGTPDVSFAMAGFAVFGNGSIDPSWDEIRSLSIGEDNSIYAGGWHNANSFILAKLLPDGSFDAAFGSGGVIVPRSGTGSFDQAGDGLGVHTVLLQDDGKIVLVGCAIDMTDPEHSVGPQAFAVVRCNADGSTDTRTTDRIGGELDLNTSAFATGGALQADGKVLVAGYSSINGTDDFVLLRYQSNLSIDSGFAANGWAITDLGGVDKAEEVAVTDDGKIVVAGYSDGDIAIVRYLSDGTVDPGFGSGGKSILDVGSFCRIHALGLDDAGRICVAGSQSGNFIVARFTADGSPDSSFGTGGVVVTDFGGSNDFSRGLAVDAQGRIVVCGYTDGPDPGGDFALARYFGTPAWNGNTAAVCVADDVAYMVSSVAGAGNLEIVDVSTPESPVVLASHSQPHPLIDLDGARDIWVEGPTAYLVAEGSGTLTTLDVSDPANIRLLGAVGDGWSDFSQLDGAWSVMVSGPTAYVAAAGDSALTIMNVADPASPVLLAELVDGNDGFNALGGARDVFVDGGTAYVTAANDNALSIIDVSNPASPVLLAELVDGSGGFTKLGGAREVFVRGGVAYVTADLDDALTIIDVSDPASPVLLAEVVDGAGGFSRLDGAAGVSVSGPVALVTAEIDDAVTMIDVSDPSAPVMLEEVVDGIGGYTMLGGAEGVSIHGTLALVAANQDLALTILDLASPDAGFSGTVDNDALAPDAVTSDKIRDGAILSEDIAVGAVGGAALASQAVTKEKIATGAVEAAQLGAEAVTTSKIAAGAVEAAQLGAESVTTSKIAAGAVEAAQLGAQAVTGEKIALGAVEAAQLGAQAVTGEKIALGAVGTQQLGAASVTGEKLANGSVGLSKLGLGGSAGEILYNTGTATEWRSPAAVLGDESASNEIQLLSLVGTDLSLSKGGGTVSLAMTELDGDPANELQDLVLTAGVLGLSPAGASGTTVDLNGYFRSDGSQAFGGTLNLGGNEIQSVSVLSGTGSGSNPVIFGSELNMDGNEIRSAGRLGIGSGMPGAALHVRTSDLEGALPSLFDHALTAGASQRHTVATLRARHSSVPLEGFGPLLAFEVEGGTGGPSVIGRVGAVNGEGAEGGELVFETLSATEGFATRMVLQPEGDLMLVGDLRVGWEDSADNDTIYFDNGDDEYLQWQDGGDRFRFSNDVVATTFTPSSDRNLKERIAEVDELGVLERVAALPITTWEFTSDESDTRHLGPMAQDFHAAFGLGADDRHISTTDADGVALAAIQALKKLLDEKQAKIDELEKRLEKLESR